MKAKAKSQVAQTQKTKTPTTQPVKRVREWSAEEWSEFCEFMLDEAHDSLLESLEDSVADQAYRLYQLGNAEEKEVRAAIRRGLALASKRGSVTQTPEDIAAGVYRDAQGRAWTWK